MMELTCLIPLYKSAQFFNTIRRNVESHLKHNARVIVSDRHSYDDTAARLRRLYGGNSNVEIIAEQDRLDWVGNINFLIEQTTSKYFRILPHDDLATGDSSETLKDSLEKDPTAILATGVILAFDLEGNRLPDKDELNLQELNHHREWTLEDALEFYWTGRFAGAFKGVVRNSLVKQHRLYIKKTPSLIHSERAWLQALALLGRFVFNPDAVYSKTYHASSTQHAWKYTAQTTLDAVEVLSEYLQQLVTDPQELSQAKFNLFHNGYRRARFMQSRVGPYPAYSRMRPSAS